MSKKLKAITHASFPLLLLGITNVVRIGDGSDISGIIIRLIAFMLGIFGATYLAAGLWHRAEKGSESWKYLSISMILFVAWNVIMTFGVLVDVLFLKKYNTNILISMDALNTFTMILKILDPVLEVIVFIILLFGLRKIIYAMRNEPWTVFSEEGSDE